jgi:hypothetical protein
MEIDPPIVNRTTEQLVEIWETRNEWRSDVVTLTHQELIRRGVSIQSIESGIKRKSKLAEKIAKIKERAKYTDPEKLFIVLVGPVLIVFMNNLFLFRPGDGYKQKNRQGLFYSFIGIISWVAVLYFFGVFDA